MCSFSELILIWIQSILIKQNHFVIIVLRFSTSPSRSLYPTSVTQSIDYDRDYGEDAFGREVTGE